MSRPIDALRRRIKRGTLRLGLVLLCASSPLACSREPILEPVLVSREAVAGVDLDKSPSLYQKFRREADVRVNGEKKLAAVSATSFSEDESKKVFKALCSGGKPRRQASLQIEYILPQAPRDLPLDQATKFISDHEAAMRLYVSRIFVMLTFGFHEDRIQERDLNAASPKAIPRGYPLMMVRNDAEESNDDLISDLKVSSVESVAPNHLGRRHHKRNSSDPVLIRGDKDHWIMSVVDVAEFFDTTPAGKGSAPRAPSFPRGYREIVPLELMAIFENYVLASSKAEAEAWDSVSRQRKVGNFEAVLPAASPLGGAMLTPSEMIGSREKIATDYLLSNTAVKQSAGKDGQTFEFFVTLNTEPLCRLGRPATDLKSK